MSQVKSPLMGRPMSQANVKRTVGKVFNRSAFQLSESILAKALTGDPHAQLAAVEMLKLGLSHDTSK